MGELNSSGQQRGANDNRSENGDVDDQFRALMEGLRTTIPGVMVLFAFLLTLPLQASFGDLSDPNAIVFYIAFITAALASVLLIAPSVHQRLRGPISGITRNHWSHVLYAIKLAIAGTVFFAVSIAAVVYLITSLVFFDPLAAAATAVVVGVVAWSWFYLPLVRFRDDDGD